MREGEEGRERGGGGEKMALRDLEFNIWRREANNPACNKVINAIEDASLSSILHLPTTSSAHTGTGIAGTNGASADGVRAETAGTYDFDFNFGLPPSPPFLFHASPYVRSPRLKRESPVGGRRTLSPRTLTPALPL